ncbi:MAG: 4-hydroxybutyrate dehydrogenase [Lachnospiraceae bacterium]|nr:4-hydroxybutyrate dehydrogenase [Lachnospiraceae bacterium]
MKKNPEGRIKELNRRLAELLNCDIMNVYVELGKLLNAILTKKIFEGITGQRKNSLKSGRTASLKHSSG